MDSSNVRALFMLLALASSSLAAASGAWAAPCPVEPVLQVQDFPKATLYGITGGGVVSELYKVAFPEMEFTKVGSLDHYVSTIMPGKEKGVLYGMTSYGSDDCGTCVLRVDAATASVQNLGQVKGPDGEALNNMVAAFVVASEDTIYGIVASGPDQAMLKIDLETMTSVSVGDVAPLLGATVWGHSLNYFGDTLIVNNWSGKMGSMDVSTGALDVDPWGEPLSTCDFPLSSHEPMVRGSAVFPRGDSLLFVGVNHGYPGDPRLVVLDVNVKEASAHIVNAYPELLVPTLFFVTKLPDVCADFDCNTVPGHTLRAGAADVLGSDSSTCCIPSGGPTEEESMPVDVAQAMQAGASAAEGSLLRRFASPARLASQLHGHGAGAVAAAALGALVAAGLAVSLVAAARRMGGIYRGTDLVHAALLRRDEVQSTAEEGEAVIECQA